MQDNRKITLKIHRPDDCKSNIWMWWWELLTSCIAGHTSRQDSRVPMRGCRKSLQPNLWQTGCFERNALQRAKRVVWGWENNIYVFQLITILSDWYTGGHAEVICCKQESWRRHMQFKHFKILQGATTNSWMQGVLDYLQIAQHVLEGKCRNWVLPILAL